MDLDLDMKSFLLVTETKEISFFGKNFTFAHQEHSLDSFWKNEIIPCSRFDSFML